MSSSGEEVVVNLVDTMSSDDVPGQFFWRKEQIRKLANYVMSQVTNWTDMAPYNAVELSWDNVATEVGVEAAKCRHKWKLLLNSVRTYRTMPEIVLDIISQNSKQDIAKFNKALEQVPAVRSVAVSAMPLKTKKKKRKVNPDHPKRPLFNGYSVFCQRTVKTVPQVGVAKMLKLAAMWKELPESERVSYNSEWRTMRDTYIMAVEKYAEEHPDDKVIQRILGDDEYSKRKNNQTSKVTKIEPKDEVADTKNNQTSKFTKIEPKDEVSDTKNNQTSKFTKIEPKDEVSDTNEDTLDNTMQTNQSDSVLFSPKKSPKKHRHTEESEFSQDSSPSKKKRKKIKKEKVWTGEDVFVEQKFDGYKLDHPDLSDNELHSKLARKYMKMAQEKTAKYKRKANERNN